jgi:hypothetical protein
MPKLPLHIDQANAPTQEELQTLRDHLQPHRLCLHSETGSEGVLATWVSYPDGFSEATARDVVRSAIADLDLTRITFADSNQQS